MNHELRKELDRLTMPPDSLTEQSDDGAWENWLAEQIAQIDSLSTKYPHNIRLHERSTPATKRLNCFAFALNIDAEIVGTGRIPNRQFVNNWIIEGNCLEERDVRECQASDSDVLLYYSASSKWLTHAGVWNAGRVISKWGEGRSHTWTHSPYEVPEMYGDEIKVYKLVSQQRIICTYKAWAALYQC